MNKILCLASEKTDKPHEECGIAGVFGSKDAVNATILALHALQHRGQESAGLAASNGKTVRAYRTLGLVSDLARKIKRFRHFEGSLCIGHNRYSTTGFPSLINSQPILIDYKMGQLAVAHNGNLTNARDLRSAMEKKGSIFQSTNDSEVFLHLIARSKRKTLQDMIIDAVRQVRGAFSLLFLSEKMMAAARDPHGVRPLCLGRLGRAWVVCSETCALDILGATYVRDVKPGEIIFITGKGVRSVTFQKSSRYAQCVFEYIYFSRPDSRIFNHSVDRLRRAFGRELAYEHPANADIVISVPDSSNTAGLGYAQASGLPFELGIIRNHYIGRTFISPLQNEREAKVKMKFNPVRGVLRGRRVVVVEDSIVRGTTLRKLVSVLKDAGAQEIHVRVSSPPIKYPCFYGMDFPSKKELIANLKSIEQTRRFLGVDTLGHLSIEGLRKCVQEESGQFCYACFSGKYPINGTHRAKKDVFERKP